VEKRHKKWATAFAIPRVAAIWIALLYTPSASIRTTFALIAAGFYAVEIMFTIVRNVKAPGNTLEPASSKFLFYGAHFSIINFALDMGSNGIKTMRIQHSFTIIINMLVVLIIAIGLMLVDPYERAWKCYPPYKRSVWDFDRGMCPQWEQYYGPYIHRSASNSGDINLVCRDFSMGPKYNAACTTGEIDASLPIFWHLASLIASISFTLSFSLVRTKIREHARGLVQQLPKTSHQRGKGQTTHGNAGTQGASNELAKP